MTTSTATITIDPNQAPTAAAAGTPTSGIEPLVVSFSSAGTGDADGSIVSYNWDFGDGSPDATTANASHTYTTPGTYEATLTVTDDFSTTDRHGHHRGQPQPGARGHDRRHRRRAPARWWSASTAPRRSTPRRAR